MKEEEIFNELTTMQCELYNYLQAAVERGETSNRIRYEISAIAMKLIREGAITTKESLHKTVYKLLEEKITTYAIIEEDLT